LFFLEKPLARLLCGLLLFLGLFFLFFGSPRAALVHQAEGDYLDFADSGLSDFNTFIIQDSLGAVFFHSLLLSLSALVFGVIGSLIARLFGHFLQPCDLIK
jgi:hypothetical protein